jgi:hypothetical protein
MPRHAATCRRRPPHLVDEVLEVLVRKRLRGADDLVQVGVHELVHQVHVVEALPGGLHDVAHADDVVMAQVAQQLDLPQRATRVREVLERIADFLDGHLLPGHRVLCRAHHAVCALANGLQR